MSTTTREPTQHSSHTEKPHQQAARLALRALKDEGTPQYIALGSLALDERNVRKDTPNTQDVALLADLIQSQGLLQQLIVVAYPAKAPGTKGAKKHPPTPSHGVIAGGRRLRALRLLVERGHMSLDEEILCTVVAPERALAISTAENSAREDLSDADTIEAFAAMARQGASTDELSLAFGISHLQVRRCHKLGNVSPMLWGLYRAGAATLEQLKQLALTEDHATQEAVWASEPDGPSPHDIRNRLLGTTVSEAVKKFVGLDAYRQAGGSVIEDLFSQHDEPEYEICDAPLMNRLAEQKLAIIAQDVEAEPGIHWVEYFSGHYRQNPLLERAPTQPRALTPDEQELYAKTLSEYQQAVQAVEDLYEGDVETAEEENALELAEQASELLASELKRLEQSFTQVLPQAAPYIGAAVCLTRQGEVMIYRDMIRAGDLRTVNKALAKQQGSSQDDEEASLDEPKQDTAGAPLTEALCKRLTSHRTRATQAAMLGRPEIALAALLNPMIVQLLLGWEWHAASRSCVQVRMQSSAHALDAGAPELGQTQSTALLDAAVQKAKDMLPAEADKLLPWLMVQPMQTLIELLTLCSALSFQDIQERPGSAKSGQVMQALGLDMAQWWTATADSYLGSVSKAMIAQAVAEAGQQTHADEVLKLKKADAATKAEQLLAGTHWLPALLRPCKQTGC